MVNTSNQEKEAQNEERETQQRAAAIPLAARVQGREHARWPARPPRHGALQTSAARAAGRQRGSNEHHVAGADEVRDGPVPHDEEVVVLHVHALLPAVMGKKKKSYASSGRYRL